MRQPLVSVLMPIYNTGHYLKESLMSIINQTYTNLEIIIVNDGCTDNSMDIVQSFSDKRIITLTNTRNLGLAASLNKAITAAQGEYLARMDADDVALPTRLEKQVSFFEKHPEVDVLGTAMQCIGHSSFVSIFPETHAGCEVLLLFNVCIAHPTAMFRKEVFASDCNHYRQELRHYSEDFDLWCRLIKQFKFHNLPEVLLFYRTYQPTDKKLAMELGRQISVSITKQYFTEKLGNISEQDFATHLLATQMSRLSSTDELDVLNTWFLKLLALNKASLVFNRQNLEIQLASRFFEMCYHQPHLGWNAVRKYKKSVWMDFYRPSPMVVAKFLIKLMLERK